MDEPLARLDAHTRTGCRTTAEHLERDRKTVLFITILSRKRCFFRKVVMMTRSPGASADRRYRSAASAAAVPNCSASIPVTKICRRYRANVRRRRRKTGYGHDLGSYLGPAFSCTSDAVARLLRPARSLAGRGARAQQRQLSDCAGSNPRGPLDSGDKDALINILGLASADGHRLWRRRHLSIPLGLLMGRSARGVVLQSAVDGDLSGAEGGVDADHHALAGRR